MSNNSKARPMMKMLCLGAIAVSVLVSWCPIVEGCWADDGKMNSQFHLNNNNIHEVSHYSHFPGNRKWSTPSKYNLTYNFPNGFPAYGIPVVAHAFLEWTSISPFIFTKVADDAQSDIKISFQRGTHGDGAPFDGKGGTLAHAFAPETGWLHYDADDDFSDNADSNSFDLKTVSVHEIGHLLGLGHSNDQQAVMFPSISPGTVKATPQTDDVNGLKALYGYS